MLILSTACYSFSNDKRRASLGRVEGGCERDLLSAVGLRTPSRPRAAAARVVGRASVCDVKCDGERMHVQVVEFLQPTFFSHEHKARVLLELVPCRAAAPHPILEAAALHVPAHARALAVHAGGACGHVPPSAAGPTVSRRDSLSPAAALVVIEEKPQHWPVTPQHVSHQKKC